MCAFISLTALPDLCAADAAIDGKVKLFFDTHCVDCHGAETRKAGLRVDTLAPNFDNPENSKVWEKIFDKVVSGQMPPASEERPTAAELGGFSTHLKTTLHDASLTRQKREGRVSIRRLNQTEYENTLSSLLDCDVDVKQILPDDNTVAGFDNVSDGLDLSASHFVRYQDAADAALGFAVPFRFQTAFKERKLGSKILTGDNAKKQMEAQHAALDGDTLILNARLHYVPTVFPKVPTTGRYRFRMSTYPVRNNGKSMPVAFRYSKDNSGSDSGEIAAVRDVPDGKATVLEFDVDMRAKSALIVEAWGTVDESDIKPPPAPKKVEPAKDAAPGKDAPKAIAPADAPKDAAPAWEYKGPALAIEWIEVEGPLDLELPKSYARLFGNSPLKTKQQIAAELKKAKPPVIKPNRNEYEWRADPLIPTNAEPRVEAERLIREFLPRAARRPVNKELADGYVAFALERLDKGYTFQEAMLTTYKAILCSPLFLILEEQPGALDSYAIAARMSYFLWRTPPDQTLLDLAAKDALKDPKVRAEQTERLLNDPRSKGFIGDFTAQWLDLKNINSTSPDPKLYVEFDPYLQWSMPEETRAFFTEILTKDLSVANFVHSDWTMLNERLARHYGIPDVNGCDIRRVALKPEYRRGGVLTQAAIMKVTADGTRTSPILRGKWVLERILGIHPTPPPPDIPSFEPDIRGATTIRQQLDKHRNTQACASCHKIIDPPGFALETYDVIGGWREFYRTPNNGKKQVELANYPERKVWRGLNVEQGDKTPDGRVFKNTDEYKQILLEDKDQLARNITQKLITFATGQDIQFADREVVESIVADARKKDYGLRYIIHQVVQSRMFLNK